MKQNTVGTFAGRQRTPGHYSSLLAGNDSQASMAALRTYGSRGYLKRYNWNSLEPVAGSYDFSQIASDLAYCTANGLKLIAMIVDKSFNGPFHIVPKGYVNLEVPNHAGAGSVPGTPNYGGYTAKRWTPAWVAAINALTKALGVTFDLNDAFEGVAFSESALSVDVSVLKQAGYTPEAYRDALIATLVTACSNMPHSQVIWFQNFLAMNNAYLDDVAEAVRRAGVTLAGPDALPTSDQLVTTVYPRYERFKGRMNMGIQMSNPGYAQLHDQPSTTSYWTMDEMINYCREVLYSNYIFWMPIHKADGSLSYGWEDAKVAIAAQPVINP